jgi:uncharacterized protein
MDIICANSPQASNFDTVIPPLEATLACNYKSSYCAPMRFEWDEQKAAQNLAKHKVPFDYAAHVFLDPYRLDAEDMRQDYGEERRLTLGRIEWRLYAVAYTMRGEIVLRAKGQPARTE